MLNRPVVHCSLNKVLASLMEKHETKSYKMKKAIGDAYIAEDTDKDD